MTWKELLKLIEVKIRLVCAVTILVTGVTAMIFTMHPVVLVFNLALLAGSIVITKKLDFALGGSLLMVVVSGLTATLVFTLLDVVFLFTALFLASGLQKSVEKYLLEYV